MIPIRIIMADDHELFRDGFAAMFHNNPGFELVDQLSNGEYLVAQVGKLRPDVVLTDIQMSGMTGVEATRIICQKFPGTPVIALSMHEDLGTIIQVIRAGAIGYLVKNASKQVVMDAIRSAYRGENFYCKTASQKISALIAAGKFNLQDTAKEDELFNATELRIINMICDGLESPDIARELNTTVRNIENYRTQIYEKAGVDGIAGLVMWAVRSGVYEN